MNNYNLYVVATPIGNLQDITFRAIETLKNVDLILAEDTRQTKKLLNFYKIDTQLLSYHAHNESIMSEKADKLFKRSPNIALVSDAGTPTISDPGFVIINYCYENNIPVSPIPGPSAYTALLSTCGFPIKESLFIGFLPKKPEKRKKYLYNLLQHDKRTIVIYESPYSIKKLLNLLIEFNDNILLVVGRELTKKYEEILRGKASDILNSFETRVPKGEFTIIINNNN